VIEVAIVRPGPIQGDMVHPYLRRRQGKEKVEFPSPAPEHGPPDELRRVLGKTLGVPLFQEQAMRIAMEAAKFTSEEANKLRRAMATFRRVGTIHTFLDKMIEGMTSRGYDRDFAERCFKQIEGFGEYGFPESHAAAFARLVYISAWLKCLHPAAFACGLLNSLPMGFYAPAQIVRDAREHGVEIREVDVNYSEWDNTLEDNEGGALAMRLGLRHIDGFRQEWATSLVTARREHFSSAEVLFRKAALPRCAMELLADADGFRSLRLDRRKALWAVRRLPDDKPLSLFEFADASELAKEADDVLPEMALSEHVVVDYQTIRLSLKAHPLDFLRALFRSEGVSTCEETAKKNDGSYVKTAGVVLVRQRPGTAAGVVFMTIEDETGIANVVIWPKMVERFRKEVMGSRLILIEGKIQKSPEGVVHLVASRIYDRTSELIRLSDRPPPTFPLSRADEVLRPQHPRTSNHPRNVRIIPKSRDFH
jgi:error-prone DNA polymerase